MAKSNKPIVWGPFAAGGTLTASSVLAEMPSKPNLDPRLLGLA